MTAVGAEVWGTFAVNDHCRSDAFLREVLLFDRVVVPVPASAAERDRWRHPNPNDPDESWDPDRLESVLAVLGTQRQPTGDGAELVWESPWDPGRWQAGRSRLDVATTITGIDAFYGTRLVLALGDDLPRAVEAVAAYPSERSCYDDLSPTPSPDEPTAADALVMLAQPLLVPDLSDGDYLRALHDVVTLANDPDFRAARGAYHDWLRSFVARLQVPGAGLATVQLDQESVTVARRQLTALLTAERRVLANRRSRRRWTMIEWAMTVVGAAASVGLALTSPEAAIGTGSAIAGFGGWVAGRRTTPPESRPLCGASMFVAADERLDLFQTPPRPPTG
ncbi:hypothetical protein [Frankia sp. CcI49]|uniref:hypothetical protein n=1 Tax=Frankia sp. CcI49 TaxID=1745382 RepID=UPI0013040B7E|nr:hypothetical protein [Frankia sp. CcI49]